ncbi:hypothetical protein CBS101457_001057 [Exobasidium rhododendri]|nr:hypothetical protein CBS101457_001057 [Exobasidium rhododendri]
MTVRNRGKGLEFCCCAIPLINFGSYTICLEFIFVALCVALLAIGPPSIVASSGSLPSGWPRAIVCVLGFVVVAWQIVGIVSIKKEKTGLYRTYIRINFLLTLVTILVTLAFFAVSAARHSAALTSCVALYGNAPAGSSSTSSSELSGVGETICNIFIWVQVGCMGLLIALIGLTQLYMCYCQRVYGQSMRRADQDQKSYNGMNTEGIPLANRRSDVWDDADEGITSFRPAQQDERGYAETYRTHSDGPARDREASYGGHAADYNDASHAPYQEPYSSYDTGAAPHPDSYESDYHNTYEHNDGRYGYQDQTAQQQRHDY